MKVNKKYKGLVTKNLMNFILVELDKDATSFVNKKFFMQNQEVCKF